MTLKDDISHIEHYTNTIAAIKFMPWMYPVSEYEVVACKSLDNLLYPGSFLPKK